MGEGSAGQAGFKPEYLAGFLRIAEMNEDDPYYYAQGYLEACEDYGEEINKILERCQDFVALKAELLSVIAERQALKLKVESEIPNF